MTKNITFYAALIVIFLSVTTLVLKMGEKIEVQPHLSAPVISLNTPTSESGTHKIPPVLLFVLQALAIIVSAKALGLIFQKIQQPKVMGEIVAGILLGPSALGWFFPEVAASLFPSGSLGALKILSQIGILLFMFLIGVELDTEILKKKGHQTLVLSHAGILFPFLLGTVVSLWLYRDYGMSGTSFRAFALFMGVAMSITAFPVLVRILEERKMTKTPLGTLAIACAAVDDVTAWCLLAGVIAIATAQSPNIFFMTLIFFVAYLAVMVFLVRPSLRKITGKTSLYVSAFILLVVASASAWVTEKIGIHALFGAFFAGVIAPEKSDLQEFVRKQVSSLQFLLLPLFFALTGLRTQIGLIQTPAAWMVCLLIIAVAIAGKFGGSTFAARFLHMDWKDALNLGTLMNARGLMELIVLNVGYDLGILSPAIFTMMVMMALATTFMTGPLLSGIESAFTKRA